MNQDTNSEKKENIQKSNLNIQDYIKSNKSYKSLHERKKKKNYLVLFVLVFMIILFYAATMVKLSAS